MYLIIIILPLLGSIVSGLFGRKIGVQGSQILTSVSILTTTLLAIISFIEIGLNNNSVEVNLFKWLDNESFNIAWNFQFDSLTVSMLLPVLIISTLVHFYSIGYMSHDPHNQRFFSYLSLFTFMMIILVTGNNYLLLFVGWEGVGVCSYLLVSFWYTRIAANQSSLSAFLTNRVGDSFYTLALILALWSLGNVNFNEMFSISPYMNANLVTIISLCLLIGAMAKSSQIGLHIWLPMAMEGPTPVSALIHAATMVTAGVYLLIRSSPLLEFSSTALTICLWIGAITTIISSLIGLFQKDIKKIIAYSTMSQLGMMVIAIGLSSYNVAIFHLINHAFYKGLLFLGAGAVIHAVFDNQDLRKYGGLVSFLPLTYTVILIASLSLMALPFMTGYYSKDFILESAFGQFHFSSINVYIIAVIGAIFTTLYSVKVIYLTFLGKVNGPINYYNKAHEGNIFLSLPLVILAVFSIYFGYITKDIFIGLGSGFFNDNSIFIHPLHEILINTEFAVPTIFKLIPFILTLVFTSLALIYSEIFAKSLLNFKVSNIGYYIFGFFNQRFLIEYFYNNYIVNIVLSLGSQTTKVLDKGSIEWVGPFGLHFILVKISKTISNLSRGIVTDYALFILIGVCFYLSSLSFISIFIDLINSITIAVSFILLSVYSYSKYPYFKHTEANIFQRVKVAFLFQTLRMKSKNLYFTLSKKVVMWFIIIISSLTMLTIWLLEIDVADYTGGLTKNIADFQRFEQLGHDLGCYLASNVDYLYEEGGFAQNYKLDKMDTEDISECYKKSDSDSEGGNKSDKGKESASNSSNDDSKNQSDRIRAQAWSMDDIANRFKNVFIKDQEYESQLIEDLLKKQEINGKLDQNDTLLLESLQKNREDLETQEFHAEIMETANKASLYYAQVTVAEDLKNDPESLDTERTKRVNDDDGQPESSATQEKRFKRSRDSYSDSDSK